MCCRWIEIRGSFFFFFFFFLFSSDWLKSNFAISLYMLSTTSERTLDKVVLFFIYLYLNLYSEQLLCFGILTDMPHPTDFAYFIYLFINLF